METMQAVRSAVAPRCDTATELSPEDLMRVSGGADTRTCEGPRVCDTKGYCEDSKGVCKE
jgi:hypothetical protein